MVHVQSHYMYFRYFSGNNRQQVLYYWQDQMHPQDYHKYTVITIGE